MAWEIEFTDEFHHWWNSLSEREQEDVGAVIDALVVEGYNLGYPRSSGLRETRHPHIRELRIQSGGRPIRVFYAFDPRQTVILLIGGGKTGISDRLFYGRYIRTANDLYDDYLDELRQEGLI